MPRLVPRASLLMALLALVLAFGSGMFPLAFPLGTIAIPLLGLACALLCLACTLLCLACTLLGFARALLRLATPLVFHWIEGHLAGSFSRSCAASSGAMRPSASSRRISLRRSASRSGSACDGKPSARITASRRERTVG